MFHNKNTITFITLILLSLTSLSCDKPQSTNAGQSEYQTSHIRYTDNSPQAKPNQTLTIATRDKSETLDLHNTTSGGDTKILLQIYETLLRVDPNNVDNLIPLLAQSWTISPNNLAITFKIKPNVKFHDGATLDANACKLSLQRLLGEKFPAPASPYKTYYDFIKSIHAKDLTLTIHLTRPAPRIALRNLAMFSAGIMSPKLINATANLTPDQRTNFISQWASGTGPYYLAKSDPAQGRTRLHPFNNYHNGKPNIKAIVFSQIPSTNTQIESLKADLVQMLDDPPRPLWQDLNKNPNISSIHKWWALNVCYLGVNTKHPNTQNILLRQAIRTAIDRNQLTQFYHNTARPTYSLIAQPFGEYDPQYRLDDNFSDYANRINAAKQLVLKANALNQKLTLYYPINDRSYLPTPHKVADKIRQMLNNVGLDVSIKGVPNGELFSSIRTDKYELVLIGWATDNGDPDNFYTPLISGNPQTNQPSASNVGRVFDSTIHDQLIEAQAITDKNLRKQIYRTIERYHQENYIGYIPLVNTQEAYAFGKRLKNVEVDPIGDYRFYNATLDEE